MIFPESPYCVVSGFSLGNQGTPGSESLRRISGMHIGHGNLSLGRDCGERCVQMDSFADPWHNHWTRGQDWKAIMSITLERAQPNSGNLRKVTATGMVGHTTKFPG